MTFPIPSEIGHATEGSHWREQGEFLEDTAPRCSLASKHREGLQVCTSDTWSRDAS